MSEPDVQLKAREMIHSIKSALERGIPHFDVYGQPLHSVRQVLEALDRDGKFVFGAQRSIAVIEPGIGPDPS